jgi:hypothetical protein
VARKRSKRKQKNRRGQFPSAAPAPIVNIAEKRVLRTALQPGRKQGVFLAVPTVDGNIHFTIGIMFARAMASNAIEACPYHFIAHVEPGKKGIDFARNSIVRTFMEQSDADWLVMIDQDQGVPENFWQLCAVTDADVVSGLTPVWVGNKEPETMLRVNNYGINEKGQCYNLDTPAKDVKQPYRVPVTGTGCIAIRRRVFAPKPHGLGLSPFYFTYEEDRKVRAGEDINFGVNVNRAGFNLCVHPGVRFDHAKLVPLWQVEQYYDARKKMEDAGKTLTQEQRLSIG